MKEIDAIAILLRLSNKLTPKRIGNRTTKLHLSYPECVLEYIGYLASRNIVGGIWEDAYKVSFADFWSSADLRHL